MPSCARRGVSLKPDSAAARVLAIETAGRENELDRRHRPCPEETLPARAALLRWPPAAPILLEPVRACAACPPDLATLRS